MKIYKPLLSVILVASIVISANAQHQSANLKDSEKTQRAVYAAIAKAYPSSVLLWPIDPQTGARQGGQFSGVTISRAGTILSAAHVVKAGATYKVIFPDGRECVARGLGTIGLPPDRIAPDAAMLQILDEGPFPFADIGWSSSMRAGSLCISISYPESLGQKRPTVRFGKVSEVNNKQGFMQSTCAMEPGDSGGPLFDLLGRVIGIHSGIEKSEFVNYEVPINTFRKYYKALLKPVDYESLPDTVGFSNDSCRNAAELLPAPDDLSTKVSDWQKSVVQIKSDINGQDNFVLGSLLLYNKASFGKSLSGSLLVSKSSMVGEYPLIKIKGKFIRAKILKRDAGNDLVLLLADEYLNNGISIKPAAAPYDTLKIGKFLFSAIPDSLPINGMLGSTYVQIPPKTSYGYLGVTTYYDGSTLKITGFEANGAASSGLKVGDIIKAVNGHSVIDELDLLRLISKQRAQDTAVVSILRDNKQTDLRVVLQYPHERKSNHPVDYFEGGKSLRRDGFKNILTQNATLKPYQCGGPVFDLFGNFQGLNIARFSRAVTLILPATVVSEFVTSYIQSLTRSEKNH